MSIVANFSVPQRQSSQSSFTPSQQESVDFNIQFKITEHNQLKKRDAEDCHPIEAITGLTKALKTYIHEQGVASATWTITHNLNKFPAVSVVDSAGNEIIAEVTYNDENSVTITMNGASKGYAYLN